MISISIKQQKRSESIMEKMNTRKWCGIPDTEQFHISMIFQVFFSNINNYYDNCYCGMQWGLF